MWCFFAQKNVSCSCVLACAACVRTSPTAFESRVVKKKTVSTQGYPPKSSCHPNAQPRNSQPIFHQIARNPRQKKWQIQQPSCKSQPSPSPEGTSWTEGATQPNKGRPLVRDLHMGGVHIGRTWRGGAQRELVRCPALGCGGAAQRSAQGPVAAQRNPTLAGRLAGWQTV